MASNKVTFLNTSGSGQPTIVEIETSMTREEFLAKVIPNGTLGQFNITVRNADNTPASSDRIEPGQTVIASPAKVAGA